MSKNENCKKPNTSQEKHLIEREKSISFTFFKIKLVVKNAGKNSVLIAKRANVEFFERRLLSFVLALKEFTMDFPELNRMLPFLKKVCAFLVSFSINKLSLSCVLILSVNC